MDKPQEKQSVIRSAAAMSLGTLSSRVLGLVRDMVLAAYFSRFVTDAFVVAFRLPNMFRRLLGEGAFAVSFIPVFVDVNSKDSAQAKEFAGAVLSLLWSVTSVLCVLGVIFMEPLLNFLVGGEGFQSVAGKIELTVTLGRIMFCYLFLVTTYAFCMSVLNGLKEFFLPAVAPAFFNAGFIIFAFLPNSVFGLTGMQLAWGVIFGGLLQVVMVILPLMRRGYFPKLRWNPKAKNVVLVLKNMIPGLIGMGILQLMGLVNLTYASRLSEGSHSYIYWADRILELPQSLIAISMGTALLPTLSELWAKGEVSELKKVGQEQMRATLYLILPCAVGMFLLAEPIVEVLFKRGSFSSLDVIKTSQVVKVYAFLLVAAALYKVTVPNFYAIKNTWLPAVTTFVALIFHIVLAHFWVDELGLRGLVGSMALAALLNLILVLAAYIYFFGFLELKKMFLSVLRLAPPLLVMGFTVLFINGKINDLAANYLSEQWLRPLALLPSIALGALVYLVLNHLFKHPEGLKVHGALLRRLR